MSTPSDRDDRHVAMRARIDMTSKPDVEYMGKHGGGGMLSPTLVVRDNNC